MHASESTYKQGEGLLVLGNLLFGQRIGLYAEYKGTRQPKRPKYPGSLPRKEGAFKVNRFVQIGEEGGGGNKSESKFRVFVPW